MARNAGSMTPQTRTGIRWRAAEQRPALRADRIHVWWACLDVDERRRGELAAHLSDRERQRAERFRLERHRHRYIAGRGLVRELLGRYLRQPPSAVQFRFGSHGKPFLDGSWAADGLQFNYTDSGDRALYAFARGCEIGVDLEHLHREVKYELIAQRRFTRRESEAIAGQPGEDGRRAFLACWTRKEAYGKAIGLGICYPLDSVELCVDDVDETTITARGPDAGPDLVWTLRQFNPTDDFVAAIVYAGRRRRLHYFSV